MRKPKHRKMKWLVQRHMYVGHPWDLPQVEWFARTTYRTQHAVMLMAVIHYSEKIPSKISKGRRHRGQSWGETRHKLPRVPSWYSHPGCTYCPQQRVVTTHVKWLPRKLISDPMPGYLLEAGCVDDLCPACVQIPGSQKESRYSAWIVLLAQFRHGRHSYQFGKWSEQSQNPSC